MDTACWQPPPRKLTWIVCNMFPKVGCLTKLWISIAPKLVASSRLQDRSWSWLPQTPQDHQWYWVGVLSQAYPSKVKHPHGHNSSLGSQSSASAWGPTTCKIKVVQETSKTQRAHDFRTTLDKPGRLNAMTKYPSQALDLITAALRAAQKSLELSDSWQASHRRLENSASLPEVQRLLPSHLWRRDHCEGQWKSLKQRSSRTYSSPAHCNI